MIRLALLSTLLLAVLPASARDPAPSPGCFDAREVAEVVQGDDHTLGIRLRDESRYRLDLSAGCPLPVAEHARLVSPAGWVCGRPGLEVVQAGPQVCGIAHSRRIEPREFAVLAMHGAQEGKVLDRVQVTGARGRGFTGSSAYCLDAAQMRGWHEDGDGIVVEVGRRNSGGNRLYRVELGGSCQTLASSAHLVLESGLGQSMVCGFPGDRAVLRSEVAASGYEDTFARPISERSLATREGCPVTAVYPIERKSRRD